MQNGEIDIINF